MLARIRKRPLVTGFLLFAALAFVVLAQEWPAAPTASDMLADTTVSDAISDAWDDSEADDATTRHEEGGWIIQCRQTEGTETTYYYKVERVQHGDSDGICPGTPPATGPDCRVVGFFHTHPNPPTDEDGNKWEQGPSEADKNWHNKHKIPGIVRNAGGNVTFGPERGVYE